jgi:hypothetical protein
MAANPERGEVEILCHGKPYVLRMTMNALRAVEKRTGKTLGELGLGIARSSVLDLCEFVWALLQPYHAAEFPTVDSVGDFIDDVGMVECSAKVGEVIQMNQPPGGAENPPEAGTGDGKLSSAAA